MKSRVVLVALGALLLAVVVIAIVVTRDSDEEPSAETAAAPKVPVTSELTTTTAPPPPTPSTTEPTTTSIPEVTPTAVAAEPEVQIQVVERAPPSFEEARGLATDLQPLVTAPSDCPFPIDDPASLPNSPRPTRSGVHSGVDFICSEPGRTARAAMEGRVVMAIGDYEDPLPDDRQALLDVAAEVGETPPWTLAMLYGNFVVVDHGVIPEIGHVVTLYGHFEELAEGIRPGALVSAGQDLGISGNSGTSPASTGVEDLRSLHLHWEIHVDGQYLGIGLDTDDTRTVYATLLPI